MNRLLLKILNLMPSSCIQVDEGDVCEDFCAEIQGLLQMGRRAKPLGKHLYCLLSRPLSHSRPLRRTARDEEVTEQGQQQSTCDFRSTALHQNDLETPKA